MSNVPHAIVEYYSGIAVKFYGKPSSEELQDLRDQGYQWDGKRGQWVKSDRTSYAVENRGELNEHIAVLRPTAAPRKKAA